MLKRAATLLLAFAVVVGVTMQVIPRGPAIAAMGDMDGMLVATSDMSTGDADTGQIPCTGMAPSCIDLMGCVVAFGAPVSPPSAVPAELAYAPVTYSLETERLVGSSIEPELFPPILPA